MSIQGEVNELESIKVELSNLNKRAKQLRLRKKALEASIAEYIKSRNLPGVRHHGKAIVLESKSSRLGKSNKKRDQDALSILEQYGVQNPQNVLKQIMEARKGDLTTVEKIKMNNLKR